MRRVDECGSMFEADERLANWIKMGRKGRIEIMDGRILLIRW